METREQKITRKCEEAGCSDTRKKRHFQLYVHERWDPHPPQEFIDWFPHSEDGQQGCTNIVTAWNSARTRNEYLEAKSYGAA